MKKSQINLRAYQPTAPDWQGSVRAFIRVTTEGRVQMIGPILDAKSFTGPDLLVPLEVPDSWTSDERERLTVAEALWRFAQPFRPLPPPRP